MTNDKINTAIAKACGWTAIMNGRGVPPGNEICKREEVPNYCSDLNAMAKAEDMCIRSIHSDGRYIEFINSMAPKANTHWMPARASVCASAKIRAEAFLRTLNLRKDTTK